jgi:hypothetical protein
VISDYTELTLAAEYMELLKSEEQHFSRLENVLQGFSIWNEWLGKVKGVGPAMGGVIISEIDIHKARHASCIWKYAGLDVANDGRGRGRYKEHLVKREYTTKDGKTELRDSVTFHPFLKTKLCGVLAGSFLRSKAPYSEIYRNEKHRLENHVKYGTANDKVLDEKGHKVTGKLKTGTPVLTFGGNQVKLALPVRVASGSGRATINFKWDGKNVSGAVCGDMEITQDVSGGVKPADYPVSGGIVLTATTREILASPKFPVSHREQRASGAVPPGT